MADQIGKDPTFQLLESAEFRTPAWHSVLNRRLLLALDLVLLVIAGTIVRHSVVSPSIRWYTINTDGSSLFTDTRIDPFYIVALLLLIYCQFTELYSKRRPGWDEYRLFSGGWLAGLSLDLLVLELSGVPGGLAGCLATWGFLAFAVPLGRCCLKLRLARFGLWNIPTVVIGCGDNALQAALALEAEPMLGLRIKAFIAPDPPDPSVLRLAGRDVPVLRLGKPALDSLRRNEGPHIVLALDNNESLVAQEVLNAVAFRVNAIDVVLPMHGIPLYGLEANHLLARELLVLSVRNSLARFMPRLTKRLFDLIGASVLLVALSPVFLVIGLALARRSGGPIVFGQQRLGQRGNPFRCLKFRIMRPDAAELLRDLLLSNPASQSEWEGRMQLSDDPRLTPLGLLLRSTHLDELPQLFNVLKGEMSLIGPRPIVDEQLHWYGSSSGFYLQVKPGITGLWQVSQRNAADNDHRVFLDCWYVKNWSLWRDWVILLRTVPTILTQAWAFMPKARSGKNAASAG